MNAETLAAFIKEPARMYQLSYQELKTLAMQYPYAQNLHLLLLEKSLLDHHTDSDRLLEKAAAYVPNRTALYQKLKAYRSSEAVESTWLIPEGEVLILKDLQSLQPLEKAGLPSKEETLESSMEWSMPPQGSEPAIAEDDDYADEEPTVIELPVLSTAPAPPDRGYLTAVAGIAAGGMAAVAIVRQSGVIPAIIERKSLGETETKAVETPATEEKASGAPLSKKHFESWRKLHQPPLPRPVLATSPAEAPPPVATVEQPPTSSDKIDPIKAIVHKSVTDNEGIASETLADLLARQGAVDRATKMYERLMLIFPEKSAYFAAKIEQLKKI